MPTCALENKTGMSQAHSSACCIWLNTKETVCAKLQHSMQNTQYT